MNRALRTVRRCLVCGSREVRTDQVVDRGILLLAECPRCSHRWTEPERATGTTPFSVGVRRSSRPVVVGRPSGDSAAA